MFVGPALKAAGAAHRVVTGAPGETLHRTRVGGVFGSYAAVGLAVAGLITGIGVEHETYVHPSHKAQLTLEETIPPELCLARIEAKFEGANATIHYKVKSKTGVKPVDWLVNHTAGEVDLASWTEKYSGTLGAIVCANYSALVQPRWDPNRLKPNCDPATGKPYASTTPNAATQADTKQTAAAKPPSASSIDPSCKGVYVVTLDASKDLSAIVYEKNPGTGWTSDTGGLTGGVISAAADEFNQIGIGHAGWIDSQQNPLRGEVMAEVTSEMTDQCVPQAVKDMTVDERTTALDAALAQPKTFTGNLVKFEVDNNNSVLKTMYMSDILQHMQGSKSKQPMTTEATEAQLKQASETFDKVMANNPEYMMTDNDMVVDMENISSVQSQFQKYKGPYTKMKDDSNLNKNVHFDPKSAQPSCGGVDKTDVERQG